MDPLMILALACASLVALFGISKGVILAANGAGLEGAGVIALSAIAGAITFFVVAYLIVLAIVLFLFVCFARAMAG